MATSVVHDNPTSWQPTQWQQQFVAFALNLSNQVFHFLKTPIFDEKYFSSAYPKRAQCDCAGHDNPEISCCSKKFFKILETS